MGRRQHCSALFMSLLSHLLSFIAPLQHANRNAAIISAPSMLILSFDFLFFFLHLCHLLLSYIDGWQTVKVVHSIWPFGVMEREFPETVSPPSSITVNGDTTAERTEEEVGPFIIPAS